MTKLKSKNGTPVMPPGSNSKDPTRQAGNRKRAFSDTTSRYVDIKKGMRKIIADIPKRVVNKDAVEYEYLVDAAMIQRINEEIARLLNGTLMELGNGGDVWLAAYIDRAYRDGMVNSLQSAKNVTPAAVAGQQLSAQVRAIQPENIEFSPGYIRRVAIVRARIFEEMKGLTDSTRADLSRVLTSGMEAGLGVRDISREVVARVGVSQSRAFRIVRTEINQGYRNASSAETKALNDDVYSDSDFELQQLWYSALSSTTRRSHARNHGKAFTVSEVSRFYARDANAINCYCSQTAVLVNTKTGEIMQQDLIDRMKKQREGFDKAD
jgi:uncharacterized protein with gpF-like domain